MAPIKTNNPVASYFDFFSRSGTDSVNPAPPPIKATGGTKYAYGGKTIHVFTSTDDFINVSGSPLVVDHLVIAGGGGGGSGGGSGAGGGGAGGVRTSIPGLMPATDSQVTVAPGSGNKVVATVGGGGAGSPSYSVASTQGVSSSFGSPLPATGGGRGGYYPPNSDGGPGGSGGGAAGYNPSTANGGPAVSGQGNVGGSAPGGANYSAGGGGGAGGAGGNASNPSNSGDGGIGVRLPSALRIPGSSIGTSGPGSTDFWVAGGGGGSSGESTPNFGVGGGSGGPYAGGGNGAVRGSGDTFPGSVNTGGGGGGSNNSVGGDGGSGLVLIAYPT
jgi:hypothetical protein